jgi:hypothetical protein
MRAWVSRFLFLVCCFGMLTCAENVSAQDTCPKGYKCVTEEQAKELNAILENHDCMVRASKKGEIELKFEPQRVTITEDGQVFTDDQVKGSLKWCSWDLQLQAPNHTVITKQVPAPEPDWGFRLRIKFGLGLVPANLEQGFRAALDPMLTFEPFYWKLFHLQAQAGLQQTGLSLGVDITRNLSAFGGVDLVYRTQQLTPVMGLALSFN